MKNNLTFRFTIFCREVEFQVECTWKMIQWATVHRVIPLGVCIMRPICPLLPVSPGSLRKDQTRCQTHFIMIVITGKNINQKERPNPHAAIEKLKAI